MKASIMTVSDSRVEKNDESGNFISNFLLDNNFTIDKKIIVKDDIKKITNELLNLLDYKPDLILTTGGTGVAPRDVTPEATKKVIEKEVPGISEAIRYFSLNKTKNAMLSRGISGLHKKTLIINLPGSKKAVTEILPYIFEPIKHALDLIKGIVGHH